MSLFPSASEASPQQWAWHQNRPHRDTTITGTRGKIANKNRNKQIKGPIALPSRVQPTRQGMAWRQQPRQSIRPCTRFCTRKPALILAKFVKCLPHKVHLLSWRPFPALLPLPSRSPSSLPRSLFYHLVRKWQVVPLADHYPLPSSLFGLAGGCRY